MIGLKMTAEAQRTFIATRRLPFFTPPERAEHLCFELVYQRKYGYMSLPTDCPFLVPVRFDDYKVRDLPGA